MNLAKFLRTPFLHNTSGRLLLIINLAHEMTMNERFDMTGLTLLSDISLPKLRTGYRYYLHVLRNEMKVWYFHNKFEEDFHVVIGRKDSANESFVK